MDLDKDLTQIQKDGTVIQVNLPDLVMQMKTKRLKSRHCSHYNPNGIMNLRIRNGETGLYGCLATHQGEKNGCRGLGTSMTGFGGYNLFLCEHKQPN